MIGLGCDGCSANIGEANIGGVNANSSTTRSGRTDERLKGAGDTLTVSASPSARARANMGRMSADMKAWVVWM